MKESVIQVDGLSSLDRAQSLERALLKTLGVYYASVNFLDNTATVHHDETRISFTDFSYVCREDTESEN